MQSARIERNILVALDKSELATTERMRPLKLRKARTIATGLSRRGLNDANCLPRWKRFVRRRAYRLFGFGQTNLFLRPWRNW